ncbi:MAG: hypothetical protein J6A15_00580 [Clostridia bacterium]|nr:hypothetical protein [Clostridia bacterium]
MLIDEVAKEFKQLWGEKFGIRWGSSDCTYTSTFYGNNHLDEVDYIDGSNCINIIKKAIKETINNDGFHIHECMQVYLDCSSTNESKQKLKEFYPIEEKNVNKYINKFNSTAKYWRISIEMTNIEDNCGWQFLEFPQYNLTNETIEKLKKELNQGDDEMFEDLIARVRVYKAKGDKPYQHRTYELTLLSDETEIFKDINQKDDRNNISKARFIFSHLVKNGVNDDEFDGSESDYSNVKEVQAIILSNKDLHIAHHNLQYEPKYRGRDGWEICGIDLTRVIMYKFTLTDNTIIRFDFTGMIDNEEGIQGIYFQDVVDLNAEKHKQYKKEKKVKKLIEEISSEWGDYVYTVFDDEHDGDMSAVDNLNGYDEKYACMIEVFSDLVEPCNDNTEFFGVSDEYIDRVVKVRDGMRQLAKTIEDKYEDNNVKVTLSKWNQRCEFGMVMYIWIPFQ